MLDGAGATDAALQQQLRGNPTNLSTGVSRQHQQQRNKQMSNSSTGADGRPQHDWQSEDSGSETNGSSDAEAGYHGKFKFYFLGKDKTFR